MKNSRNWTPLAILLSGTAAISRAPSAPAQATHPPAIVSISVCSPTGSGGQGSCPSGSFDTHQIVLAPDGNSIGRYGGDGVSEEHSSVFSPGMLGSNSDDLFFVASGTSLNVAIGAVVLSGGPGPDKNGQWTFDFPKTDGYGFYPGSPGPHRCKP